MDTKDIKISIIIAVFERQEELTELLQSLTIQTDHFFEVTVVDDGSKHTLEDICLNYQTKLDLKYYYKENSGPGESRNFGMERANGNYFIFLDSDTIVPATYIACVKKELSKSYVDAYGGPDDADETFTFLQKAITFSMTSFLTTGGIRGGKKQIGKFQPRSFNMGISKNAYQITGGFTDLRVGEDPDLSMRLWENGFETRLFKNCKVIHKRRTSLIKFAKQVYQFGVARPILDQRHPNFVKATFWFPSLFFVGTLITLLLYFVSLFFSKSQQFFLQIPFVLWLIYLFMIFMSSTIRFKSAIVGVLSIQTTLIQFFNYGYGFLESQFKLNVLKLDPKKAFPKHFHIKCKD